MMILVVRNIHAAQPVRSQFIHPILWPRANRSSAPNLAAARAPIGPAPSQSALRHRRSLLYKRRGGGSRRLIPTPAPVTMLSATCAQLPALLLLLLTVARASSATTACLNPWVKFQNLCLRTVCHRKTWPQARQRCQSEGGDLVWVANLQEHATVTAFYKKNLDKPNCFKYGFTPVSYTHLTLPTILLV